MLPSAKCSIANGTVIVGLRVCASATTREIPSICHHVPAILPVAIYLQHKSTHIRTYVEMTFRRMSWVELHWVCVALLSTYGAHTRRTEFGMLVLREIFAATSKMFYVTLARIKGTKWKWKWKSLVMLGVANVYDFFAHIDSAYCVSSVCAIWWRPNNHTKLSNIDLFRAELVHAVRQGGEHRVYKS